MEKLKHLVQCFKPGEIQLIKAYYSAKFSNEPPKRLLLLNLILEEQISDNHEAAKSIYAQYSASTISKLKERLKKDLLDFLLLFPFQKLAISELSKAELRCAKLLLQSKILLARGVEQEGIQLLQKAANLVEEFELPASGLDVYDILCAVAQRQNSQKEVEKYNQKISRALDMYTSLQEARQFEQAIMSDSASSESGLFEYAQEKLKQLQGGYTHTTSKRVKFWFSFAALQYHFNQGELTLAADCGRNLVEWMETDPFLCKLSVKMSIYIRLSWVHFHLGLLKEAGEYAALALEYSSPNAYEELEILGLMFMSYFQLSEFSLATQTVEAAFRNEWIYEEQTQLAKWNLCKAALEFAKGDYNASLKNFLTKQGLFRTQPEIFLGGKLLELLNIIELGDYDWVEYKLESFRKTLNKYRKGNRERFKTIYQILRALLKAGFDFPLIWEEEQEKLSLLQAEEGDWCRNPLGSELINFYEWMLVKVEAATTRKNVS